MDRKVWKKYICERIQEVGRQSWKNGFNDTEREKEYVKVPGSKSEGWFEWWFSQYGG